MTATCAYPDRRAFTLVEMVVVTALAASFMAAAASVVASIGRSRAMIRERQSDAASPLSYLDILRFDLINARGMKQVGSRIIFVGYGAIDPETGIATQQPAEITYDTRDDRRRRWLVRQQRIIGANTNRAITMQPILGDVSGLELLIPTRWKERYEKSKLRIKPEAPSVAKETKNTLIPRKQDVIAPAKANPTISPPQVEMPVDPLIADPGWAEVPPHLIVRITRDGVGIAEPSVEQFTLYPRIDPPQ